MRYKILGLLFVGAISGAISARAEMTVLMATQLTESEMPILGAGYVPKKFSHVDLNLGYDASTKKFSLGLRTADGVQYTGSSAIAYVPSTQRTLVPGSSPWSFLGASGATFWSFPSSKDSSSSKKALFLGWAAYDVESGIFEGAGVGSYDIWVHSIENLTSPGNGDFFGYATSGSAPVFYLSSAVGYANKASLAVGGHGHMNMALTGIGLYRIQFKASGRLVATDEIVESDPMPIYFGVESWQLPVPTGYDTWKLSQFSAEQVGNPLISGPSADPDEDGATNLQEYAFGENPLAAGAVGRPTIQMVTLNGVEYLGIRFQRRTDDATLTYEVQSTENLATAPWPALGTVLGVTADAGVGLEWVTFRAPKSMSESDRQFLRVQLRQTPGA